jgi:hypothetical protein
MRKKKKALRKQKAIDAAPVAMVANNTAITTVPSHPLNSLPLSSVLSSPSVSKGDFVGVHGAHNQIWVAQIKEVRSDIKEDEIMQWYYFSGIHGCREGICP